MSHFPILHLKLSKGYDRLSQAIAAEGQLSPVQAKDLIALGAVYVNRERSLEDLAVKEGFYLRVHTRPRRFKTPEGGPSGLIFHENEEFIIANKPQGLPSHPTLDNSRENLLALLARHAPVRLTHRLDQFTAGLMVFAKTAEFQRRFSKWLERRAINKEYVAFTEGALPLGPMLDHMNPKPVTPRELSSAPVPGWKACELKVLESVQTPNGSHRSRLRLVTGRTHQIRAQLAFRGLPIIGDSQYGSSRSRPEHPTLIAVHLEFPRSKQEFWSFSLVP